MSNFKSYYKIVVCIETSKFWFVDDLSFHIKKSNCSIEYSYGSKYWYQNGKRHRKDGPAIVDSDGSKEWYQNGERHREDGPAFVDSYGSKFWYLNGEKLSEEKFNKLKDNP